MQTPFSFPFRRVVGFFSLLLTVAALGTVLQAQVVIAPTPTVGSSNPVTPEPTVTRVATTPCVVPLFTNMEFNDYNERTYTYTPPANCPGPWAQVVFTADLTVTAGIQYDRSAQIYLNNVTIYRGTTAEPSPSLSPSWHVERDVTDLSAAFTGAASGIANIQNIVNSTYTGIIYANAALYFYPVSAAVPAATVPDMVIPIYETDPSRYYETTSPLTEAITFPTNVEKLYLDLTAQTDEFWWLSTPNATLAPLIQGVDATAFREMDVSIDGTPAGIAPQHPYIFTGGIDPYLWIPITGAQTLNLKPYRVNLTPFAGVLDDGNPHTFVVNDINTQPSSSGGSLVNGNLLVYLDHGGTTVTGAMTSDTLTANPSTTVTENDNIDGNENGEGSIMESLDRTFTISGYVNTSAGKITTTINETVNFSNAQNVQSSDYSNVVSDVLTSTVDSFVTTETPSSTSTVETYTSNPLKAFIAFDVNDDGTYDETTIANLADQYKTLGPGSFSSDSQENVTASDTLLFDSSFDVTGEFGQASTGNYIYTDSNGNNYSSTLNAANNVLTSVDTGSSSSAVTLFVTASKATVAQGAAITLTATVTPKNSTLTPTGYVTFYANATTTPVVLGTVPVTASGASLTVSTLPVGTDLITASYSGDGNFVTQTGLNTVSVTVTAVAGAISLGALNPASLTLTQGQSGIMSLPITANATFSGTVTFTCSGAPAEASCTVNPSTVNLVTGQTSSVSVVVATTAPNSTYQATNGFRALNTLTGISIAGLVFLLLPGRRNRRRWNVLSLLGLVALGLGLTAGLSGCSGGGNTYSGTPVGTTTLTVTATSGTLTQSATFTLIVNK